MQGARDVLTARGWRQAPVKGGRCSKLGAAGELTYGVRFVAVSGTDLDGKFGGGFSGT